MDFDHREATRGRSVRERADSVAAFEVLLGHDERRRPLESERSAAEAPCPLEQDVQARIAARRLPRGRDEARIEHESPPLDDREAHPRSEGHRPVHAAPSHLGDPPRHQHRAESLARRGSAQEASQLSDRRDSVLGCPRCAICDPACGTGGFLLSAHEDVVENYPSLTREQKKHLTLEALHGVELVPAVTRLCAMNLMLHGIGPSADEGGGRASRCARLLDACGAEG